MVTVFLVHCIDLFRGFVSGQCASSTYFDQARSHSGGVTTDFKVESRLESKLESKLDSKLDSKQQPSPNKKEPPLATFQRFEDIHAWKKARLLANSVYRASGTGRFGRDFGLKDQIRRSSVSIMSNIAEGQGRRTDRDFANFINMAIGSVAETKSHLYLALDLKYLPESEFSELYCQLDEIGKMLTALGRYLLDRKESRPPN